MSNYHDRMMNIQETATPITDPKEKHRFQKVINAPGQECSPESPACPDESEEGMQELIAYVLEYAVRGACLRQPAPQCQ